jgi:environmental stress-induced protein Ves
MALRKSPDARELEKLTSAFERATKALDDAERTLKTAEQERDAEHERQAADAFLDDSPEAARLNGKIAARFAEAMAARDAASAAVRGLRKRGRVMATKLAGELVEAATKACTEAAKDELRAHKAHADARAARVAADVALAEARHEQTHAAAAFVPDQAAARERSDEADATTVKWAAGIPWDELNRMRESVFPRRLRARIAEEKALREAQAAEHLASKAARREESRASEHALALGEEFPRLPPH